MTEQAPPGSPVSGSPPALGWSGVSSPASSAPAALVPPPPREAWQRPRRVETIPGTPFGMVHLEVPPITSGLAVGSLVAGIASILVATIVACFGLLGARGGWGAWAAGAFVVLGGLAGLAGIGLGELGRRQVRRAVAPPAVRFTGRGLALSGLVCGATGLGLTVLAFLTALVLQLN